MKILILSVYVIFMIIQVFSDDKILSEEEIKNEIPASSKICKERTDVTDDQIDKARNGDIPDNYLFKRHLSCFYERLNILIYNEIKEKQLEIYLKVTLEGKTEEQIKEALNDCKKIKRISDEFTAYELAKCITKHKKM